MQAAVPPGQGAMAAILGLEDIDVEARPCADEAAHGEVVEAVNFNAPGQVVIAGSAAAVARAIDDRHRERAHGVRCHCRQRARAQFAHAARGRAAARAAERTPPSRRPSGVQVYGVDVKIHIQPDEIRAGLVKQLHTPVYWAATVRTLIAAARRTSWNAVPARF